jgi:Protein of unknown function (DUF4230)
VATLTEERPASPVAPGPTEVVVRVDNRRRRPSLLSVIALGVVGLAVVMGFAFLSGLLSFGNLFSSRTVDRSAPVILHRLRNLSSYNASSGTFSVTVDVEKDVSILPQFIAGSRVIYSGYGTVDAAVDLGALDAQHVTTNADGSIIVTLPHAKLGNAELDPARSHVMNRDRGMLDRLGGIFVDSPTSERPLERAAITKINRAARSSALVTRAERNTATMVKRLATAVGIQKVDVRFGSVPSATPVPQSPAQ